MDWKISEADLLIAFTEDGEGADTARGRLSALFKQTIAEESGSQSRFEKTILDVVSAVCSEKIVANKAIDTIKSIESFSEHRRGQTCIADSIWLWGTQVFRNL